VVTGAAQTDNGKVCGYRGRKEGKSSMMLRTLNLAGTHIYPMYQNGQIDAAHDDKEALTVFVPDGPIEGDKWACTVERLNHGAVVIETREELARLITALEIAYERVRAMEEKSA
jgi:hypothetical protein